MARAKVNKAKAKKASNGCCPVIHIKCRVTKGKKRHFRDETGWTHETLPGRKVCAIKLGNRTVAKTLTPEKAGKRVNDLRKALLDKRCQAIVTSEK